MKPLIELVYIGRLPGLLSRLLIMYRYSMELVLAIKAISVLYSLFGVGWYIFLVQMSEFAGHLFEIHYPDPESKIE